MRFSIHLILIVMMFAVDKSAANPTPGECLLQDLECFTNSIAAVQLNSAPHPSPVTSEPSEPQGTGVQLAARDPVVADARIPSAKAQIPINSARIADMPGQTYAQRVRHEKTKPSSGKACYFWFETNTQKYLDKFIRHHKDWKSTGSPIVTARIDNVLSYTKRLTDAGIPVISGFKTSGVLRNKPFHDRQAWATIAEVARKVSSLTGGKPVVLENEGAVTRMISNGIDSIDHDALVQSLSAQSWPEIWFWYAPMGQREPVRTVSRQIAYAIKEAIPNARLIEASSAGYPSSSKNPNSRTNLKSTLAVDNDPISIIYLDDQQTSFWPLRDTNLAVKSAYGSTVVVYPGFADIENASSVVDSMHGDTACQNVET